MCTEPNHAAVLRRFEWTLLTLAGYAPDLQKDSAGCPVEADRQYWLQPEHAVLPLEQRHSLTPAEVQPGVAVDGNVLIQLQNGEFTDTATLQQARRITRLLLDFRLPEGIKSRQVLQQIQAFR